jgi:Na+/proline symporter
VYATAWTFYGSVGRAASDGVGFLPIYIGPTLMIALWWVVMRKILRISRQNRITSLADFIASRYGKSALIGGLVTVIAVIGILPYISLQLTAISSSYSILVQYPEILMPAQTGPLPIGQDTAFWVALILAAFTIAFGTRHLDAAEHHQGMVAAIAFESLVKLLAFLAVGLFVTFGLYNGFGDLSSRAAAEPKLVAMMTPLEGIAGGYAGWVWLTILSMMAIMFLPRQFQVTVIENLNEKHLNKAIWLFPAYMQLVEAHRPDLVLLDVMMPVKSGYEVCERMRSRAEWRDIKIIMLTAKGRDVEMTRGLSTGADLCIIKPFSTQELVARINALLGAGAT